MKPVSPLFPVDIPPTGSRRKAGPDFTPGRIDLCAGRGRRQLWPALLQSADRTALCEWGRFSVRRQRPARGYFSAFDPATGELKWQQTFDGWGRRGRSSQRAGWSLSGTGSNTQVFVRVRREDGELLWKFNTGAGVFSSPSVYMVNGEEFVTVASGGGERGRAAGT